MVVGLAYVCTVCATQFDARYLSKFCSACDGQLMDLRSGTLVEGPNLSICPNGHPLKPDYRYCPDCPVETSGQPGDGLAELQFKGIYLGGLPEEPEPRQGRLVLNPTALYVRDNTKWPPAGAVVQSSRVRSVSFGGINAARRYGGVIGLAIGTRYTGRAELSLTMHDGHSAFFAALRITPTGFRAAVSPLIQSLGLSKSAEANVGYLTPKSDLVSQLIQLAQLRDQGTLSESEFEAAKSRFARKFMSDPSEPERVTDHYF